MRYFKEFEVTDHEVTDHKGSPGSVSGQTRDEQGTGRQTDSGSCHSGPAEGMPACTCQESARSTAYKVSGHKDGVHPAGCLGSHRQGTGLVTDLYALHTDVNEDDTGMNPVYVS